jgi:hypothetical protein
MHFESSIHVGMVRTLPNFLTGTFLQATHLVKAILRPSYASFCNTAANQGGGLFGGGANNQAAQAIAQGGFGGGINQGQAGTWAVEGKRRLSRKVRPAFIVSYTHRVSFVYVPALSFLFDRPDSLHFRFLYPQAPTRTSAETCSASLVGRRITKRPRPSTSPSLLLAEASIKAKQVKKRKLDVALRAVELKKVYMMVHDYKGSRRVETV